MKQKKLDGSGPSGIRTHDTWMALRAVACIRVHCSTKLSYGPPIEALRMEGYKSSLPMFGDSEPKSLGLMINEENALIGCLAPLSGAGI